MPTGLVVAVSVLLVAAGFGAARADPAAAPTTRFPAAGELLVSVAPVRARPDPAARVIRRIRLQSPTHQLQTVLALRADREGGHVWYQLSLAGRPNNQRGWIDAAFVDVHPVSNRITIRRAARTIEVRTIGTRRLLLRATVAVGAPGSPTPLGRDYYVLQGYFPTDPFYGSYALATSAYSSLTDWPGGGIVGIHGTNRPELLGQAVSHGCIRVSNPTAAKLERLAPPGTPIDILH